MSEKYEVAHYKVENLLTHIMTNEIVVPEIQRPFVWSDKQVRDLIDSLYNGYPTGYLIMWQNPNVRLKNGEKSGGKKILIDGQQRVTALMTAIVGRKILTANYREKVIRIAFNPVAKNDDERFAVTSTMHIDSKIWIEDISKIFAPGFSSRKFINQYLSDNPAADEDEVENSLIKLSEIKNCPLGVIKLKADLEISEVTEIFVRINSQGKRLNEADFAMSKIAANGTHNGVILRKTIDYFCRLISDSAFYSRLESGDAEFMASDFSQKISWLKNGVENIYSPDYSDMLRVSFMNAFNRGKVSVLVDLLSGRDFVSRTFKEEIADKSFADLSTGIKNFVSEYNFKNFILAIKSAGFVTPKLLNSQMTLDFAYTLYLILQRGSEIPKTEIKRYVQKWFVLSTLTGRYTASPESQMDRDLREIEAKGFKNFFEENALIFSDETFWDVTIAQKLETSSIASPYFNVYVAAQIFFGDHALLSNTIRVENLITIAGDIHHIFPKDYLKSHGRTSTLYNQIANYAYLDTTVNISIGKSAPREYFAKARENFEALEKNLEENCIPREIFEMTHEDYGKFLERRRALMAKKIQRYYEKL